jgi:hypothetical protein
MKNQSVFLQRLIFVSVTLLPLFAVEAQAIEKAKYEVIESDENIELRQYAPRIVAETFVAGDFKEVGNVGFRLWANRCGLAMIRLLCPGFCAATKS